MIRGWITGVLILASVLCFTLGWAMRRANVSWCFRSSSIYRVQILPTRALGIAVVTGRPLNERRNFEADYGLFKTWNSQWLFTSPPPHRISQYAEDVTVEFRLPIFGALFALYPAFVCVEKIYRARRRKDGRCIRCGAKRADSLSAACPRCGARSGQVPAVSDSPMFLWKTVCSRCSTSFDTLLFGEEITPCPNCGAMVPTRTRQRVETPTQPDDGIETPLGIQTGTQMVT